MKLKEKINADYMTAFRAKNTTAKNLLSVIKGEIQTTEKNTGVENMSDEDVMKILKKTVKSLKETNASFPSAQTAEELFIAEAYLPTQMSEEDVRTAVDEIIASMRTTLTVKEMGKVMGLASQRLSGKADGKLIAQLVKEMLN